MFGKATCRKLMQYVPKAKLSMPSLASQRLKAFGSVARAAILHLDEKLIFMRTIGGEGE